MDVVHPLVPSEPDSTRPAPRAVYVAPRFELLGAWSALTLQQSVPIGPGSLMHGGVPGPQLPQGATPYRPVH